MQSHPFDVKYFPGQTVMFYEPGSSGIFVVNKNTEIPDFYFIRVPLKTR